ncbi:MAG: hypothetical protein M0Z95_19845 [Actinomycetota bacterium]|nr:hypothetical protein [Actinomycetota bacterium]
MARRSLRTSFGRGAAAALFAGALASAAMVAPSPAGATGPARSNTAMTKTIEVPNLRQPSAGGYWEIASDGGIFSFGAAQFAGSMGGQPLNKPVVGGAATPSSNGYWEVASDGGIFSFGTAPFEGSMGGRPLNAPIVGMAPTPTGQGYWEVAADGGIFSFGAAGFRGSMGGKPLNKPVVGMAATPTGNGYWEVASDGGIFNFGDAPFQGSMGGQPLNAPIVGMAATPTGSGYWEVASDGGIFSFGAAQFYGSMGGKPLNAPIVGMAATPTGGGYTLVAADGGTFNFGAAKFYGSMGGKPLNKPIVGMAMVGPTTGGQVLLVGTYDGHEGQYQTIQKAVNAAQPGDWILIAPGDYKANATLATPPSKTQENEGWYGGVTITTPDLHIRGMTRSKTIVDGTKPGTPACTSKPTAQELGATVTGSKVGRNGILVWQADNVTIQNLTVCNFLNVKGNGGNEIWWNGGEGSGTIGLAGYSGSYLTATSTFDGTVGGQTTYGNYGIFASTSAGPGVWDQIYANNFDDSGMYVGACQQACDAWIHNAWMENSALGYSGTNSGGIFVIDHSQFDNNEDGFDTNTQSVGDPPPPQNGTCPDGGVSAFTHTTSCWVFMDNYDHNNNNPTAPGFGAVAQPTGTGMTVSGATHDTVMDNTFATNGAWGTLIVPYPDTSPGGPGVCTGSGGHLALTACVYDPEADALVDNTYTHDGFFGNPSNGDFGQITFFGTEPQNCFVGNVNTNGTPATSSDQPTLEQKQATCGPLSKASTTGGTLGTHTSLINQVLCDTGFASFFGQTCTSTDYKYPTPSKSAPVSQPIPSTLPTMPNPCEGVPQNAWCPAGKPT